MSEQSESHDSKATSPWGYQEYVDKAVEFAKTHKLVFADRYFEIALRRSEGDPYAQAFVHFRRARVALQRPGTQIDAAFDIARALALVDGLNGHPGAERARQIIGQLAEELRQSTAATGILPKLPLENIITEQRTPIETTYRERVDKIKDYATHGNLANDFRELYRLSGADDHKDLAEDHYQAALDLSQKKPLISARLFYDRSGLYLYEYQRTKRGFGNFERDLHLAAGSADKASKKRRDRAASEELLALIRRTATEHNIGTDTARYTWDMKAGSDLATLVADFERRLGGVAGAASVHMSLQPQQLNGQAEYKLADRW